MPGFNGTGPLGQGPMTGRGFGHCQQAYRPAQQPGADITGVEGSETSEKTLVNQPSVLGQSLVFGTGRGMRPWGCGRGLAFGGCKRRRGRSFGTHQV